MGRAGMHIKPAGPELWVRAWELYANHSWRKVAEILSTEEGYPVSYESARQWGYKGRDLVMTEGELDPKDQQYRSAEFLEQWMGKLATFAADAELKDVLEILDRLKWMYNARQRLIGTESQPKAPAAVQPPAWVQEAIANSGPSPEEEFFG